MESRNPIDLVNQGPEELEKYWSNRLSVMKSQVEAMISCDGYVDSTTSSLLELMEEAISLKQYSRPSGTYTKTKRIVKIRLNTPKSVIEKIFGVKTIGVYGVGLFAVLDGVLFSSSFRSKSNFDRLGKKGVSYDLSEVPEDLKDEYEFGLSISAFEGIFVPKKSVLTSWITRSSQLEFFDLSI